MNQKYYLLLNVGNIEWKQSTSEILKLDLFLSLLQLCRLSCCMTDERSAPHSLLAMLTDISNTARDDKDLVWNTGELNSFITVLSSVESFIVMKYFQRGIQIPLLGTFLAFRCVFMAYRTSFLRLPLSSGERCV